MKRIFPPRLRPGDTVGMIAPCVVMTPDYVENAIRQLEALGFRVKLSEHFFSHAFGYAGSVAERAADFNAMIADDSVNMLLFGGGEVGNELLPCLDYDAVRRHPKIICSYSDSTTLLNAIHCETGLVTFYGASPRTFDPLTDYNWRSFENRFLKGCTEYAAASPWRTVCPGACEGVLTGGYLVNYATLYGLPWYPRAPHEKCLLFIEDHEMFSSPAVVAKYFANLAHRGALDRVVGLIFGHYSNKYFPEIDEILRRVGERFSIPVVRCEDFGHGDNNAVLPIGVKARLDADKGTFALLESGVTTQ